MNFSKKNHKLVDQNESEQRKSQKHDANLQKNTTLYFQVGLILVLMLTYGMFEMNFQTQIVKVPELAIVNDDTDVFLADHYKVLDDTKPKEPEKKAQDPKVMINPTIIDISSGLTETPSIITPEQNTSGNTLNPEDITVISEPIDEPIGVSFVHEVPIFPGCETQKTNKAKRKCMSDKISKHVSRKFNTDVATDLGLDGRQRINVLFKIDKHGHIAQIKASAKHPDLVKEAERVISKLPKMKPGKQDNKYVDVLYALPILFKVHN